MKKIVTTVLSLLFISCTMTACGNSSSESSMNSGMESENTSTNTSETETSTEDTEENAVQTTETIISNESESQTESDYGNHILVAYFSATGTTKGIAETIADTVSADIFEIIPANIYTDADLDYNDNNSRTSIEQNDKSVRPEIADSIDDISKYDIVFVGYPIWWGEEPRIMDTFVESYDFTDITVIPFCTSGGSGMGRSGSNLAELANGGNWLDGAKLNSGISSSEVSDWVNSLGISVG